MYDVVPCERCGVELPAIAAYCARCGAQRTPAPSRSVASSAGVPPPHGAPGSESEFVECARCAEPIRARATACRFCGHEVGAKVGAKPFGTDVKRVADRFARVAVGEVKSPGLAACLSFLCPGLGQLYAGQVWRGIVIFLLPSFVFIVFFVAAGRGLFVLLWLASLGFYIWQIADAYACASPSRKGASAHTRSRREYRRRH